MRVSAFASALGVRRWGGALRVPRSETGRCLRHRAASAPAVMTVGLRKVRCRAAKVGAILRCGAVTDNEYLGDVRDHACELLNCDGVPRSACSVVKPT
jgi:hypothetical protein